MATRLLLLAFSFLCTTGPAFAWVYPEHRDISILAVSTLDPEHRAIFDELWAEARVGNEKRLCAQGADSAQGVKPECVDWAAMPAIAGDHSCSSQQMLDMVTNSERVLELADIAAQLKLDLAQVPKLPPAEADTGDTSRLSDLRRQLESEAARAQRTNALRVADIRLQAADPEYATRRDPTMHTSCWPVPDPTSRPPNTWRRPSSEDQRSTPSVCGGRIT